MFDAYETDMRIVVMWNLLNLSNDFFRYCICCLDQIL